MAPGALPGSVVVLGWKRYMACGPRLRLLPGLHHMLVWDPGQVAEPFRVWFLHLNWEITIPTSETVVRMNQENLGAEHHVNAKITLPSAVFGSVLLLLPAQPSALCITPTLSFQPLKLIPSILYSSLLGQELGRGAPFTISQASSWEG